jgi:hypothetical protein
VALRYKFIELSIVTAETLEVAVNDWVAKGWKLDDVRFVANDRSNRPAMAFLSFTREAEAGPPEVARPSATGAAPLGAPRLVVADDNDVD